LPGRRVEAGQPILTLETKGGALTAYAFFPLAVGKKVRRGNPVLVSPTTVERSIYGAIKGQVRAVALLPSDRSDLLARFGNDALVKEMLAAGPPLAVKVRLTKAPHTPTGFAWTSSAGPEIKLTPGTMAAATVVVRRVRPISLLVPVMAQLTDLEDAHAAPAE